MKRNNKGYTLVEVIVSFSLIMIVMIYLLRTIIVISEKNAQLLLSQEYNVFESILLDKVYRDFDEVNNLTISNSGSTITFDEINKELEIDVNNKSIIYDDIIYELPEGVTFKENPYKITKAEDNSFYVIDLNFQMNKKDKYMKIIYQKPGNKPKYGESILNGADPVIRGNLIPVTIEDSGKVKKADTYKKWYSYNEKKWANAVILKDKTKTYNNGTEIPESNIESYFVWIPKYSYKLFDMGNYKTRLEEDQLPSITTTIDIKFGLENTKDTSESCATPLTSGGSGNCSVGKYMTHPAFITMDTNGFWVGKFETTGSIDNISIKPNLVSLRDSTLGNVFDRAYNYNRSLDSHMMKNTEWGALAYLTLSKYGIDNELRINNSQQYITGCAATTQPTEGLNTSLLPEIGGVADVECENAYNTSIGYLASTTGNITGIYDISGGAWEYIAAYVGTISQDRYDIVVSNYNSKYFDVYNTPTNPMYDFSNRILGDATGEVAPVNYVGEDNWYYDHMYFARDTYLFDRGGSYFYGIDTGPFACGEFAPNQDYKHFDLAFRIVLTD